MPIALPSPPTRPAGQNLSTDLDKARAGLRAPRTRRSHNKTDCLAHRFPTHQSESVLLTGSFSLTAAGQPWNLTRFPFQLHLCEEGAPTRQDPPTGGMGCQSLGLGREAPQA